MPTVVFHESSCLPSEMVEVLTKLSDISAVLVFKDSDGKDRRVSKIEVRPANLYDDSHELVIAMSAE